MTKRKLSSLCSPTQLYRRSWKKAFRLKKMVTTPRKNQFWNSKSEVVGQSRKVWFCMGSDSIILICKCKYFWCRSDGMRNGNLGGICLSASVCHTDKHDSCLSRVKWGPGNTGAGPESQSALYVEVTINSPSCLTSYHQVRQSPYVHGCSLRFQSRANQHVQLKHRSFGPQLRPWAICSETLFWMLEQSNERLGRSSSLLPRMTTWAQAHMVEEEN